MGCDNCTCSDMHCGSPIYSYDITAAAVDAITELMFPRKEGDNCQ